MIFYVLLYLSVLIFALVLCFIFFFCYLLDNTKTAKTKIICGFITSIALSVAICVNMPTFYIIKEVHTSFKIITSYPYKDFPDTTKLLNLLKELDKYSILAQNKAIDKDYKNSIIELTDRYYSTITTVLSMQFGKYSPKIPVKCYRFMYSHAHDKKTKLAVLNDLAMLYIAHNQPDNAMKLFEVKEWQLYRVTYIQFMLANSNNDKVIKYVNKELKNYKKTKNYFILSQLYLNRGHAYAGNFNMRLAGQDLANAKYYCKKQYKYDKHCCVKCIEENINNKQKYLQTSKDLLNNYRYQY